MYRQTFDGIQRTIEARAKHDSNPRLRAVISKAALSQKFARSPPAESAFRSASALKFPFSWEQSADLITYITCKNDYTQSSIRSIHTESR